MHDDVIITKFFPLCFKIAESFESLENILHDWAKDKYKKSTVEALDRYEKHSLAGKRKIKRFLSLKMAQQKFSNSPQSRRQTKHKNGIGRLRTIA